MNFKDCYDMGVDFMDQSGLIFQVILYKQYMKDHNGERPAEGMHVIDPANGQIVGYVDNENIP